LLIRISRQVELLGFGVVLGLHVGLAVARSPFFLASARIVDLDRTDWTLDLVVLRVLKSVSVVRRKASWLFTSTFWGFVFFRDKADRVQLLHGQVACLALCCWF
jgi:hypothetical protein